MLHLVLKTRHNVLTATTEKVHQIGDHLSVPGLIDCADAGSGAELDVMIQAGALVLSGDHSITGKIREDASEGIQCLVYGPGRRVGPEIARTVLRHLACDRDLRKWVSPVNPYVGIALVVLQADVVPGAVLLD